MPCRYDASFALRSWGEILRAEPGSPGWLPTQGPHRPARAELLHAVLRIIDSLSVRGTTPRHAYLSASYLSLLRCLGPRFHSTLRVSQRQFYDPTPPFPPQGPIRSGSPASSVLWGRYDFSLPVSPRFVSFAWQYHLWPAPILLCAYGPHDASAHRLGVVNPAALPAPKAWRQRDIPSSWTTLFRICHTL